MAIHLFLATGYYVLIIIRVCSVKEYVLFLQKCKRYYKLPLFNAEVKAGKPISNLLRFKARTVQMSIRPTTIKSQMSTNSSYIELSFNADKDHYLCYQWTRAIEVIKNRNLNYEVFFKCIRFCTLLEIIFISLTIIKGRNRTFESQDKQIDKNLATV